MKLAIEGPQVAEGSTQMPTGVDRDAKSFQLRELFVSTCDLPKAEQIATLDEHCSDDPELRRDLERLLECTIGKNCFSTPVPSTRLSHPSGRKHNLLLSDKI